MQVTEVRKKREEKEIMYGLRVKVSIKEIREEILCRERDWLGFEANEKNRKKERMRKRKKVGQRGCCYWAN